MSYHDLLLLGIGLAVAGVALQLVYMPLTVSDLHARRQRTRGEMARTTTPREREEARRNGRAVAFFIASRLVSSTALMTVHLLIVISVALVLQATRVPNPPPTAWFLSEIRAAVSGVVIVSTASQMAARWWAMRR